MAKPPGTGALNSFLGHEKYDLLKFGNLWTAIGADIQFKVANELESDFGTLNALRQLFLDDKVLAEELCFLAVRTSQNDSEIKRHWKKILAIELISNGIENKYGKEASLEEIFTWFKDYLLGEDLVLEKYFGRSPYDRMVLLTANWIRDYDSFRFLTRIAISRIDAGPLSEQELIELRKPAFAPFPVDTGVVNAWTNINKFGGH
jgi:hypothetical protein